jgi:hypothetical protein
MNIPIIAGATYGVIDYTTSVDIKEKISENPASTILELSLAGTLWGSFAYVFTKANFPSHYNNALAFTFIAGGLYHLHKRFR